jgi:hypothetical protein
VQESIGAHRAQESIVANCSGLWWFSRAYGTDILFRVSPASELAGYYQSSLRDSKRVVPSIGIAAPGLHTTPLRECVL